MRGQRPPAAPSVIRLEQCVQHVVARRQRPDVPLPLEGAHRREGEEHLGEHVVVRGARGRLGVVFRDGQAFSVPRRTRRGARPGSHRPGHRHPGAVSAPSPRAGIAPGSSRPKAPRDAPRGTRAGRRRCGAGETILFAAEKPRAQHGAQRAVAEEETAPAQLIVERCLRLGRKLVAEQLVIPRDRIRGSAHAN